MNSFSPHLLHIISLQKAKYSVPNKTLCKKPNTLFKQGSLDKAFYSIYPCSSEPSTLLSIGLSLSFIYYYDESMVLLRCGPCKGWSALPRIFWLKAINSQLCRYMIYLSFYSCKASLLIIFLVLGLWSYMF